MWSVWSGSLPRTFTDAQKSMASAHMPVYTGGMLSRLLLLGDLVTQGIVVSPTDTEMADLIVKANRGAMKGLEILGCTRTADRLAEALCSISDTLNVESSPSVKSLFHGGEVGLFDVEHILCKIARKQQSETADALRCFGLSTRGQNARDDCRGNQGR